MVVTEVVLLLVRHDTSLTNVNNDAQRVHTEALDILASQPGIKRFYWGAAIENRHSILWFVEWRCHDDYQAFKTSKAYTEMLLCLDNILSEQMKAYRVNLNPYAEALVKSPIRCPATEIVHMYFPKSHSQDSQDKVAESVKSFMTVLETKASGYLGFSAGWVDGIANIPETNEQGLAYLLLVGWTSVEAHQKFTTCKTFEENIHLVLGLPDLRKIEVVHTNLIGIDRNCHL